MKLYNTKRGSKVYEECSDGSKYFVFNNLDGAFSHCTTEKGETVHLSANADLIEFEDGYKIAQDPEFIRDNE